MNGIEQLRETLIRRGMPHDLVCVKEMTAWAERHLNPAPDAGKIRRDVVDLCKRHGVPADRLNRVADEIGSILQRSL